MGRSYAGACALMWVAVRRRAIRIMQEEMGYDPLIGINVPLLFDGYSTHVFKEI